MPRWTLGPFRYGEKYMQNGQFVKTVTVGVTMDDGTFAELDIPQAQYNADTARALAEELYQTHASVRDVQGT